MEEILSGRSAEDDPAIPIYPMRLKHALRQIQANHRCCIHDQNFLECVLDRSTQSRREPSPSTASLQGPDFIGRLVSVALSQPTRVVEGGEFGRRETTFLDSGKASGPEQLPFQRPDRARRAPLPSDWRTGT